MFIGYVIPLGVNSQKSRVLAMPGACTTGKMGLALQRGADTGASRAWALWTPSYEGQRGKLGRRAAPVTSSVPLLLTHGHVREELVDLTQLRSHRAPKGNLGCEGLCSGRTGRPTSLTLEAGI